MKTLTAEDVQSVSGGLRMTADGLAEYYAAVGGAAAVLGAEPLALVAFGLSAYFALA